MNNRERQLLKASKWYFRSNAWYYMGIDMQVKEFNRICYVMRRSRCKR